MNINNKLLKVENRCVTCSKCKITTQPFKSYNEVCTKRPLEVIHSDVCDPMRVPSQSGSVYFVTFVDEFSRFIYVYFLKRKSAVFSVFKDFLNMAETQTGQQLKMLRSDNGCEYLSHEFDNYLKGRGIIHQTTTSYTPQQNGIAERANRTFMEMARCMVTDSN